jgi:para-nitrobenzyl esterase
MKKLQLLLLVLLIFLAFAFQPSADKSPFATVKVDGGSISGTMSADGGVQIFKGIPFAAPPVGDFRWKEPQPVIPWQGTRRCEAFGASAMQNIPALFGPWSEEYLIPKEPISEDCLTLNVWTAAKSPKEKLPVIVWIYGGGFTSGGSACPIYDGTATARKGVIFVSANYRVGLFGFFAHPDLTAESPRKASGNYGLMDQVAALQWVQRNIAAFGGDPGNVTIAGQSAGSMAVNALVASPLTQGLIHRAIAESGAGFLTGPTGAATLQQGEESGQKLAQSLNAPTLAALRAMPTAELMKAARGFSRPIVDGYVLPQSIAETFASNKQNDVPVITGWNEDDAVIFGKPKTAEEFAQQAKEQYGNESNTFLSHYPATNDDVALQSQIKISRDQVFGIQNYTWANVQSEKAKSKIYVYRFTRKLPATGEYARYGAFHTGEVAYAWDNLDFVKRCPWEPVDRALASTMSTYWVNFIKTGDPNGDGLASWPAYNTRDQKVMMLSEKCEATTMPDKAALDFLTSRMR